jgi:hypothetical protein
MTPSLSPTMTSPGATVVPPQAIAISVSQV